MSLPPPPKSGPWLRPWESSKLPPGENTIQLNNGFNALAVDGSVHEVEPNVPSQGQISPLENPNLTNLLSTPYPSNPTTSKTRVLDNQTENDAEIGASAAQTDASKNLEGPIVIIGDSIIKDIIPENYLGNQLRNINSQVKRLKRSLNS